VHLIGLVILHNILIEIVYNLDVSIFL